MPPAPERPAHIDSETWETLSGSSQAKNHHWVPAMLLRLFSEDSSLGNAVLWRQPAGRGAPRRSTATATAECTIQFHNTVSAFGGLPPNAIEAIYARIEAEAAPVIRTLAAGNPITPTQRRQMANFIAAQHVRTPRMRAAIRFVGEKAATVQMVVTAQSPVTDRSQARKWLSEHENPHATDAEVDKWFADTADALQSGKVRVQMPHDMEAELAVSDIDKLSDAITNMAWIGLRTSGDTPFVLSDHPISLVDPVARRGGRPAAWRSSEAVEATLPLTPGFCLLMVIGPAGSYREEVASDDVVLEINIRSAAHAWRAFYGPSQAAVQTVRQACKSGRTRFEDVKPIRGGVVTSHRIQGADAPYRIDVERAPSEIKVSRGRHWST